jgi:hypothetical protein
MREGFGSPDFIYKYSNKEKVMQPGPFNAKNNKLYSDIEKMLGELKMPAKDAKGNIKSRKVRGAYAKGADRAQAKGDKAMDKAADVKADIDDTIKNIDRSLDAEDRRDERKRKARKEEVEVEEGKLVDRIMRKRKQLKNKGTIPGSDGY